MICVSLQPRSFEELQQALRGLDRAEVRLEGFSPTVDQVREIFASGPELVATMRPGSHSESERAALLAAAASAGAAYVDIELEASVAFRQEVIAACRRAGTRVIVSYHDFHETPGPDRLRQMVEECFDAGADLAKVACWVKSRRDAARLLGLLDSDRPVIALGMGPLGRITRLAGPLLGSPFTFCAPAPGQETAAGQFPAEQLQRLLEEVEGHGQ